MGTKGGKMETAASQEKEKITLVYAYYDSPDMFGIHQKTWMEYPEEIIKHMEFIVTDDCSPNKPAKDAVILPKDFPFRLYRVKSDIPWNWRTCRNIGAHESTKGGWIIITDIDHLIPGKTMGKLLKGLKEKKFDKEHFYTFDRVIAPDMRSYKNHPNTYFLHRDLYWKIGGYDEVVSGYYGLDGVFRRRMERHCRGAIHLDGYTIVLYQRDYVFDASVSTMPRKENRNTEEVQKAREKLKRNLQKGIRPKSLSFPYERVI